MSDSAHSRRRLSTALACRGVPLLYGLLGNRRCRPAQAAFDTWRKRSPHAAIAGSGEIAVAVRRAYGIPLGPEDLRRALFALDTWVALSAKLAIAEQLAPVRGMPTLASPRSSIAWAEMLAGWEAGHFLGWDLGGALEPAFFGWPVACWNPALGELVQDLAQVMANGWPLPKPAKESATALHEDPLAWLYQALVPRGVRHALGEYFTPVTRRLAGACWIRRAVPGRF